MYAIYAYIGVVLGVNVGIYGSPMECLGNMNVYSRLVSTPPIFGFAKEGRTDLRTNLPSFPVSRPSTLRS